MLAQYNKDWNAALTHADNDEDKAMVIFKSLKNHMSRHVLGTACLEGFMQTKFGGANS